MSNVELSGLMSIIVKTVVLNESVHHQNNELQTKNWISEDKPAATPTGVHTVID